MRIISIIPVCIGVFMHVAVVYSQSNNTSAPSVYPSGHCQGDCHSDTVAPSPNPSPTLSNTNTVAPSPILVPTPGESATVTPSPTPVPTLGDVVTPLPTLGDVVTQLPTPAPTLGDSSKVEPSPTPFPTLGDGDIVAPLFILDSTLEKLAIQLTIVGNDGSPSSLFPLGLCQGDCDSDRECRGSLTCFQRSGSEPVPGCQGIGQPGRDYCHDPMAPRPTANLTPMPTPQPNLGFPANRLTIVGNNGSPSSVFPLGRCQGDCDSDSECQSQLICFQRSGLEPVPGCQGSGVSGTDYCIDPKDAPAPTLRPTPAPFNLGPDPGGRARLKLYWEEGYFWQEEDFDRRWCASYNYRRSYCWYSQQRDSCESDRMYFDTCGEYDQDFEFQDVGNSEILIRTAESSPRCWQRSGGTRIYLRPCNSGDVNQRWVAQNGGFNDYRFEISPKGATSRCATSDHHPKAREVVELHVCDAARRSDTSFWERD